MSMSSGSERSLQGMRVAIVVTQNFEQVELTEPRKALEQAGATVKIVSPQQGQVQAMQHDVKSDKFDVDLTLDQANPADFDAVMLPGGVINADKLRMDGRARAFVARIDETDRPIAVICHGPWLLVDAGLVSGRTLTSYASLKADIRNAGGRWLDGEVVRDRNWVSSRGTHDIPAFNKAMVELFAEYLARRQR